MLKQNLEKFFSNRVSDKHHPTLLWLFDADITCLLTLTQYSTLIGQPTSLNINALFVPSTFTAKSKHKYHYTEIKSSWPD